jgi:DNA-binding transcriptional LysR family regulator
MQNMQKSFDRPALAEMAAFVVVADQLSFSRAGEQSGCDATILSRRVRALEMRLGVRLLERTTRTVALTEAGRRYLVRARAILRAIDEADREAGAFATGEPRGHLRLALPGSFGRIWLAPLIAEFLVVYPRVTIEAEFSNRFVDLIGEGFDLAVRLGELGDSRLIARRICGRRRLLCASPAYLARAGTPKRPEDLSDHACLVFSGIERGPIWDMTDAFGTRKRVTASGPYVADDAEALVEAATAGLGVLLGTDWLVAQAVRQGRLVPVLADWQIVDEGAVYVVTPSGSGAATKTRAFSDWVVTHLSSPPWQEMLAESREVEQR